MTGAKHWWLHRRHLFTREQLNNPHWPHPRPARDPRLVTGYIAIMGSSITQAIAGAAPTSVQGRNGFDPATLIACAVLAVVGGGLVLYAAWAPSQYWSFVTEGLGCFAIIITYCIYLWGIRVIPEYWATNYAWWCLALILGHSIRAFIIGRRFW
jgi:hypothetical protein